MEKIIIAAVSQNNVIGADGTIPWHSKEDFKHFKNTTMGFPLIMGRKTFESFKKPLPGRTHIVVTRNKNYKTSYDEVIVCGNISDAIKRGNELNSEKIFLIGGGEIYKMCFDLADKMIISHMHLDVEGDTYFPEIDPSIWDITDIKKYDEFTVNTYSRI